MDIIKKILLVTTGVVLLGIFVSAIVLTTSVNKIEFPKTPALTDSATTSIQDAKTKEITSYQTLSSELIGQKTDVYDFITVKTLVPLFNTLIAGIFTYIIAKFGIESIRSYAIEKERLRQNLK